MSIAEDALKKDTNIWECLGPISSGGTIFGLAVSPVSDVPRWWAATSCGIFSSDDEGATWSQGLNGLTTPLLSALYVAPNGALFAGSLGGSLFSSFDYGGEWEEALVPDDLRAMVTAIVTSPNFSKNGAVFAATDGRGLLASRDSGKNWEDSSFGLGDMSILAVAVSPDLSKREMMFAATSEGVFVSRNGGRAWRETELVLSDDAVEALVVSPDFEKDRTVYAGTEGGSLYHTTDSGRTWDMMHEHLADGPLNCLWLAPDYTESGRMLAALGAQIYASSDHGESWKQVAELPNVILSLTGDAEIVLAGLYDAGIWKSADAGETWASCSESLAARGFAWLLPSDSKLHAMGPQEGLFVSAVKDISWEKVPGLSPFLPLSAASLPTQDKLFVASQEQGIVRSSDNGDNWKVVCDVPNIQTLLVLPGEQGSWAGALGGALFTSKDGGETWIEAESPCAGQDILSIVASPNYEEDKTLFMGTAMHATANKQARIALWRSTNGGQNWRQLTTQVTEARWVDIAMPLGATENVAEQAILATGPFCLRPLRRAKDVWISTRVEPGGANTLSVIAVGEVDGGGVLYAATGNGIYRSIDSGRTWQPFSAGITSSSFVSIVAMPKDSHTVLYALSLGGLLWKRELE